MTQHRQTIWLQVDYLTFDRYLREYPRPLVPDPPLNKPARLREWSDVSLGPWPANAVAKLLQVHGLRYLVRDLAGEAREAGMPEPPWG